MNSWHLHSNHDVRLAPSSSRFSRDFRIDHESNPLSLRIVEHFCEWIPTFAPMPTIWKPSHSRSNLCSCTLRSRRVITYSLPSSDWMLKSLSSRNLTHWEFVVVRFFPESTPRNPFLVTLYHRRALSQRTLYSISTEKRISLCREHVNLGSKISQKWIQVTLNTLVFETLKET